MREILFKAKRIDNGEWVEGLIWKKKYNSNKIFISCFPDMDDNEEVYVVDANTICQYTGLTDKNGKKIWENDILIYDNSPYNVYCTPHKGEIVCRNGCLCFKYWLYGSTNYMPFTADLFFDKKSEVIGNIFDNAELVKG